ncbi:NAD(P)-binding domain-containing protein [Bradyrhizobium sp. CCGUVB23]|uniref:NAD(P)-binding domain-containing protein n=1 Tax=Bradyrhizobium sp. CCGUVB23 TaxID=2949630 RepID=UPI0020B457E8|nr:NAD(P)-binding domain-containing protein [Bradyrhizobium sp. CCGUVB23]MCP3459235.1 lysine N(6)-hydroxylase/L-ornithine N(5)-oxygenase family protein [Bradyrhizobium sp. CCGUVB23]
MREVILPVAVIGAGPFGVSTAAYLRSRGVEFRIFGSPMHRWRTQMPAGMFLKSEGFASNLADPIGRCTLQQFCNEEALPYEDARVSLETFTRYAVSFQQRLVPMVEDVLVTMLDRQTHGFRLRLATGEEVRAKKVVVATGLSHAEYIPAELAKLPAELLSHSSDHHHLDRFTGREVLVIGSGQSALETAALLNEAQAKVTLLVRRGSIEWHGVPTPGPRSLWQRLRRPASPMGNGLKVWLCAAAPTAFYHLPEQIRVDVVRTYGERRGTRLEVLGPSGSWWLKERVVGRVPILLGHGVREAEAKGSKVGLRVDGPDGASRHLTADHVIAATGYRYNVGSLPFLGPRLISELRCVQEAPSLSPSFESSIPGLYFAGIASAYNFGPVMRFLCGTDYAARRISSDIARQQSRSRSSVSAGLASARNRTAC